MSATPTPALVDTDAHGGMMLLLGNQSQGVLHAAALDGTNPAYAFCHANGTRAGKTRVRYVEGYAGAAAAMKSDEFPQWDICADCLDSVVSISADHDEELARVAREGPTAGRLVRTVLHIEQTERVHEGATLHSIKDARERSEWRWDRVMEIAREDGYTVTLTTEFADEEDQR